jgi:hypothetical protein
MPTGMKIEATTAIKTNIAETAIGTTTSRLYLRQT